MASNCDRFVDYFVVCGLEAGSGLEVSHSLAGDEECAEELSPLERSYKCRILGHFPNSVAWNPYDPEAISTMCLPHGLEFRTQKHKLDPRFHGFVITREDGSRYYGFALTFYEEVRDSKICTALHTLQSMHIAESSRGEKRCPPSPSLGNTKSLPRHFRLSPLVDKTAGDSHKYYDIGKDQLFASKAIAVICQYPFVHMAKEFLCGLHRMVTRSSSSFAIEDYVCNVIFGIPLPTPGTSVGVRLWGPNSPLLCLQLPRTDEELPLLEFPFRVVFSLLPPRPLVQFFTSALLEHQILLFSRDFNRLFLIAECVTALLFPFAWEHVYVPIVPASLMHFLDAPVPYIMGLQCSKKSRRGLDFTSQASLCVVDIDKGKVEVPEDTPCFPREDELIRDIQAVLAKFGLKEPYDKNRNERLTSSLRRRKPSWSNDSDSGLSSDRSSSPSRQHQRQNSSSSNVASVLASPRITGGSRIAAGWQRQRRRGTASADASEEEGDDGDDMYFGGIRDSEAFRKIEAALGNGPTSTSTPVPTSTHIRDSQYVSDMKLNNGVREVFLDRFVRMFSSFENFVIQPNQDIEGWLSNRDSMQNFDKSTYLGDQPAQHRSFLSRFLETQMFTSFIDSKILESFGQRNPRVKFFCRRILKLRERLEDRGQSYEESMVDSQRVLEPRLKNAEVLAVLPSRLSGAVVRQGPLLTFPPLDTAVLNKVLVTSPLVTAQRRTVREKAATSVPTSSMTSVESASKRLSTLNDMSQAVIADKNWKFVEELLKEAKVRTKRLLVEKLGAEAVALGHGGDASISGVEENTLIAALCDLLERIWSHGRQNKQGKSALWFHLHNYQQLEDPGQGIDPNQLTPASRIIVPKPYPRLALPQILLNLKKGKVGLLADQLKNIDLSTLGLADAMKASSGTLPRNGSGANLLNASSRSNSLARMASSLSGSASSVRSPSVPPRMSRFERNASVERGGFSSRSRGPSPDVGAPSFRPMPKSLTFDMSHVQAMEEIKTEVGYARAWVRLALEKKLLSSHLRTLLSNYDLMRSYYKRYAFLRCDDEREQFLFHLLSLNAVDFFCYTNTYTKTVIPYQVLVVPSKRQSTTSASVWVSLTGTLGETKPIELPRGSNHALFEHRNLGVLSSLTIGHDNSGMSPNWHVDHVLVRNEVTGHTYFFACGRWLGRAVDDGSTVRLLVGELLPNANEDCGSSMSGSMFGSMSGGLSTSGSMTDSMYARASSSSGVGSSSSSRPQSPALSRKFADSRLVGEIQGMLSDAVNILVKYFHKKESDRGGLTQLLCGEGGLLMAFERAVLCGFKSSRLFSKNLYLWDYLVRVQAHYVATIQRERAEGKKQTDLNKYRLVKSYCILIDKINKAPACDKDQKYKVSSSLGKDDKFQLFVCISVRDHLLSWFLDVLAAASPTSHMYEEWSFMREPSLLSFMKRVLGALDEFEMSLETSVSKGILPSMYKSFQPPGVGNGGSNQPMDPARGRERRRVVQR